MTIDLYNLQPADLKGGYAVQDPEMTNSLSDFLSAYEWKTFLKNDGFLKDVQTEYKDTFKEWILSSNTNSVTGLDNFPYCTITNGTSESFAMFMMRHNHRTFKFFQGDFIMHKVSSNVMNIDWAWIDNENELHVTDAMIISCPFSNTATEHHAMQRVLNKCNELRIPVLIDMAYYGSGGEFNFDLNHSCIEEVTFSLGKTFPIIGARAGIRFQKEEIDDAVLFANQNGIVNNFACVLGTHAMKNFSADYLFNKYEEKTHIIAGALGGRTTNSVLFQVNSDPKWQTLRRSNRSTDARLCVSNLLVEPIEKIQEWRNNV